MSTAPRLRALVHDVVRSTRGHDLALYAAGVTFYAAVGLVPLLLVGLWLAGLLAGDATVRELAHGFAGVLPDQLGARQATEFLAEAGTRMTPLRVLGAVLPATLYGEGMVRALDRLSGGNPGKRSLRGRAGALVVIGASPLLLLLGLSAASGLSQALGDGVGPQLLGVYVAFLCAWVACSLLLVFAYRGLASERPCKRALAWGASGTGSVLAGTSLGFVLFLSLGLDLGTAFGGSAALGVAAAALGWLFGLHVVVLLGYVVTLRLDRRFAGCASGAPVVPARSVALT